MKVKMQTLEGKASGDIELPEAIFGLEARADILHRVVVFQRAGWRAVSLNAQHCATQAPRVGWK